MDFADLFAELDKNRLFLLRRAVSGTYRNAEPAGSGRVIELRVDVDGSRPQQRLSGDVYFRFRIWGFDFTIYLESFVVESPDIGGTTSEPRQPRRLEKRKNIVGQCPRDRSRNARPSAVRHRSEKTSTRSGDPAG